MGPFWAQIWVFCSRDVHSLIVRHFNRDMPTPYPDATFHTVNIKKFAEDVKAATNGGLTIKIHSAGSLFKHKQIKKAVRSGQVPIGEFFMGLLANENPVCAIIPYLVKVLDTQCSRSTIKSTKMTR